MRQFVLPVLLASVAFAFTGVFKPGMQLICTDSTSWNSYLSLRLMDSRRIGPLRTDLAWVVSPTTGNPALEGANANISRFRIADPDERIFPEDWNGNEHFSVLQNIDRLSIRVRFSKLKLTMGRQAIFWGVSKSISPTDFIAPFPYGAINTDYRAGVDAVRAVYPVGMMSEIEAGGVFGDGAVIKKSGFWLRTRLYALNTDITVLAAEFRENKLLGASLNRAIGGSVGWVESAVTKPEGEDCCYRLSTGLERSFWNSILYGFVEYHFNQPGVLNHNDYLQNSTQPAYTTGGVYLMAEHYLATGLSVTATPLLTVNASGLFNMNDYSIQFSAGGDYSLSDNSSVSGGISGGLGSEQSEFGSLPTNLHLNLFLYF
ncbi:MAG: hypothetical protein J7K88_01785 [Candidatus Fermentibacteraceae bacterium]|nr:hypothetical protein [Candidatus Fermentibacteraceae bacterium]